MKAAAIAKGPAGAQDDFEKSWSEPSAFTDHKKVVKVIITQNSADNDATLLIFLENPAVQEYIIHNKCPFTLEVRKYNHAGKKMLPGEPLRLGKEERKVFVWDTRDITDRQVYVRNTAIKGGGYASLDSVSERDRKTKKLKKHVLFPAKVAFKIRNVQGGAAVTTTQKMRIYSTLEVTEQSQKVLTLNTETVDFDEKYEKQHAAEQAKGLDVLGQTKIEEDADESRELPKRGVSFDLRLRGISLSMIDAEPKELMCASILGIKLSAEQFRRVASTAASGDDEGVNEERTHLRLTVRHVQVDNLVGDDDPVIFCPKQLNHDLIVNPRNYKELTPLQAHYKLVETVDK